MQHGGGAHGSVACAAWSRGPWVSLVGHWEAHRGSLALSLLGCRVGPEGLRGPGWSFPGVQALPGSLTCRERCAWRNLDVLFFLHVCLHVNVGRCCPD